MISRLINKFKRVKIFKFWFRFLQIHKTINILMWNLHMTFKKMFKPDLDKIKRFYRFMWLKRFQKCIVVWIFRILFSLQTFLLETLFYCHLSYLTKLKLKFNLNSWQRHGNQKKKKLYETFTCLWSDSDITYLGLDSSWNWTILEERHLKVNCHSRNKFVRPWSW